MKKNQKKKILKIKNYQNHSGSLLGCLKQRMNHKTKQTKIYSQTLTNKTMIRQLQVSLPQLYKKFNSNCTKVKTHQNSLCSIFHCVKVP